MFCFLLPFREPDVLDTMFLLADASNLLRLFFVDVNHVLVTSRICETLLPSAGLFLCLANIRCISDTCCLAQGTEEL